MNKILSERIEEIKKLCQRYRVKSLYAFGSVGTDTFNNKSDIDLLIDFDTDLSINDYSENYFALHYKLRDILKREIDLVTQRSLSNPYFIQSIEQTKQLLYES